MAAKPFKHRPALSGLPKDAERDLIDQFKAIENDLAELRALNASVSGAATPILAVPSVAAKVGELLLLAPPADGTLVTIPQGSPENITKRITLAVVGGHLSPGVAVSIVGRKGTINGQQTLTLNSIRLVELVSIGAGGWVFDCCVEAAYPVGSIYISTTGTNPSTTLGFGTWTAFGAGRVPVGFDAGQTEFDLDEETGGAKTHTLTPGEMPSHTHVQNAHTHTQNPHTHIQNAHTHIQNPHTHTQNSHNHTQDAHGHSTPSDTVVGANNTIVARGGANPGNATIATTIAVNLATIATNQDQTAVNQNQTATNQDQTAVNQNQTATNQNTGGGAAHNNLQPYIVVRMWKRTA
jgi:microcystin-dependent protein